MTGKPLKIGMEAERANLPNPTGVERFASELIANLSKLDTENQYLLYFRTQPMEQFKSLPANFVRRVIPFPKFWTQTRLALELLLHPVDVFFLPIQALPFVHPRKSVIVVHDIAYEFFPDAFPRFMRFYLKLTTRFGVRAARKIIAVSESTKSDLVKTYKLSPDKISVVHLGVDSKFAPLPYEQTQKVLDKYNLSYKKYILFLGTLQPRKNISRLVDAYITLRQQYHIEEKLVIAGGRGWLWEPIESKLNQSRISGSVVHLGYVDEQDKQALYNGAVLLTLPALYEGFGLPPLEAMACGTPVVVSNISSLPEVVGDAGVLVDPNSAEKIAEGILKVLSDKSLQAELGKNGIARAKQFTWERTAAQTLAVLESLK
ncbi:MAG TPA: glycosyltransferase family 1 protein [Patescibacteria group bacterium]|nr:glycosyltransferase family 1 protein [Patescibacteria group bacterium]